MGNETPGRRISRLREQSKLTQEDLGERSGLSLEQVQALEADELSGLAPLVKVARGLGVRMGTFLDDDSELGPILTRAGGASEAIRFSGSKRNEFLDFKSLALKKSSRHMEPFLIVVDSTVDEGHLSTHEGEEFLYVLEGQLEILYRNTRYALHAGDSIYYDSIVPHCVGAPAGATAKILAVVYAPY